MPRPPAEPCASCSTRIRRAARGSPSRRRPPPPAGTRRPWPTTASARRPDAMPEPAASLDEIRALLAHLPGPDLDAGSAAATHEAQLTKPAGALGRLEELALWLATWQGRHPPRIDHP